MRVVGRSPSSLWASSTDFHSSEVVAAESETEDVYEVPIDDNTAKKKAAVPNFDVRSYTRKKVWLAFFQVEDVENPLRAASQTHEDRLMASLRKNKYQYGVGLMTVASPSFGMLGFLNVDSTLEQRGKDRFLETECSLAFVDGRHRRFCNYKLSAYKQSSSE